MQRHEGNLAISPAFALALAILAISWGSILVRLCSAGPLAIACYRMALAALFMAPFAIRPLLSSPIPRETLARIGLASAFLAIHFGAWIWSLSLTSIGSSVVLVSTQPLFSAMVSGLALGERAPARIYAGVALSIAGTILITGADFGLSRERLEGDLLSLLAAAAAAACFIVGRSVRKEIPFTAYFFLLCAIAAALLAGSALVIGQPLTGFRPSDYLYLAALAILPTLIGHGCLNWAVRHIRVYYVNLAAFGEPILATIYARILFGEPVAPSLFAGGGLIISGILLSLRPDKTRLSVAG